VSIQAVALCAIAVVAGVPWISRRAPKEPVPAPKPEPKKEQRIRVIRIPRPEPARAEAPKPPPPKPQPPKEPQRAAPKPLPAKLPPKVMQAAARPPEPAPIPAPERHPMQIAPDVTSVKGVRIVTYVRDSPAQLAAHLHNSGGCLVVGNVGPEGTDFVTSLEIEGNRAVESSAPMCSGAPKTLSPTINAALGDPLGRVRAEYGPGNYQLQAILTPELYDRAHAALAARFGTLSEEEMGRQAEQTGYQVRCYAEPTGLIRCE
jgi:hypothetical protein